MMPVSMKPMTYQLTPTTQEKNKPELHKNTKKYVIAGSSLLMIIVGIIKRKTISNFVKKILKKTPQSLENVEKGSKSKTINKIELPKPNFTVGKENLEQYAKEKANYIQSIWEEYLYVNPPYKPMNKEKNILGLQALQKYGTREDLLKLHDVYQISKDSEIMKEYAKLVGKVGLPQDII